LLGVKRKLALLLISKLPTIKKAVELINSIGVLKLTAINFKKTNIMKKMVFGLIATVMLSVSGNANSLKTNSNPELKIKTVETLKARINIDIMWGRKSKNCQGFGICGVNISIEIDENKMSGVNNGNGVLSLEFNETQLTVLKKHFGSSEIITISEDYSLSDNVCEKLELKRGYIIKKGEYAIKTLDKGLYTVSF
jgi:hypothetical protein